MCWYFLYRCMSCELSECKFSELDMSGQSEEAAKASKDTVIFLSEEEAREPSKVC